MKLLNKVKITLLIALFIIIFFNLKSFAVTGVITEITVNMRKEPSTDSKRLMFVTQDYKVEVLEKVGEWYKIKYNGVTGYIFGEYLDVDDSKLDVKEPEIEEPKQEEIKQEVPKQEETTNKKEDTNTTQKEENKEPIEDVTTDVPAELQIKEKTVVKLIPNISSNGIYTSEVLTSIDLIEQFGNWSYIYVNNIYGWVRTDNIVEKDSLQSNPSNNDNKDTNTYIKCSSNCLVIKERSKKKTM